MKTGVLLFLAVMILSGCAGIVPADSQIVGPAAPDKAVLQIKSGITTNSVYIKWSKFSGVSNYLLYCSQNNTNNPLLLTNTAGLYYFHSGLSANTTNYYRIVCSNDVGGTAGDYFIGYTKADLLDADPVTPSITTKDTIKYSYNPDLNDKPTNELVILTLNMHTYQEANQDQKFDMIVDLIARADADLVALQECAQHKNSAILSGIIRSDNMAYILTKRLKDYYGLDYYYVWDWAHYGWSVWEEGIAVLSKTPPLSTTNKYITAITSVYDIKSRKVIYSQLNYPVFGKINFFSTHLYWRESSLSQLPSISSLKALVDQKETQVGSPVLTLVCGDYNVNPTSDAPWSEGYFAMVNSGEYIDTYFNVNPTANNKPALSQHFTVLGDFPGRIDYIFMKTNSAYQVVTSQIIFTPTVLGVVSDHYGVLTRIRMM